MDVEYKKKLQLSMQTNSLYSAAHPVRATKFQPEPINLLPQSNSSLKIKSIKYNIPSVLLKCEQFQMSDRSVVAAVSNALLADLGIVRESNHLMAIDLNQSFTRNHCLT